MLEAICSKPEAKSEVEQWRHFPKQKRVKEERELSKVYGWFDLPRDGGGDINLADFPLDYQPKQKTLSYNKLP